MFNPIAFRPNKRYTKYLNSSMNSKLLKGAEISELFHIPKAFLIPA